MTNFKNWLFLLLISVSGGGYYYTEAWEAGLTINIVFLSAIWLFFLLFFKKRPSAYALLMGLNAYLALAWFYMTSMLVDTQIIWSEQAALLFLFLYFVGAQCFSCYFASLSLKDAIQVVRFYTLLAFSIALLVKTFLYTALYITIFFIIYIFLNMIFSVILWWKTTKSIQTHKEAFLSVLFLYLTFSLFFVNEYMEWNISILHNYNFLKSFANFLLIKSWVAEQFVESSKSGGELVVEETLADNLSLEENRPREKKISSLLGGFLSDYFFDVDAPYNGVYNYSGFKIELKIPQHLLKEGGGDGVIAAVTKKVVSKQQAGGPSIWSRRVPSFAAGAAPSMPNVPVSVARTTSTLPNTDIHNNSYPLRFYHYRNNSLSTTSPRDRNIRYANDKRHAYSNFDNSEIKSHRPQSKSSGVVDDGGDCFMLESVNYKSVIMMRYAGVLAQDPKLTMHIYLSTMTLDMFKISKNNKIGYWRRSFWA